MLNAYIPEPLPGVRAAPFLAPEAPAGNRLFQRIPPNAYADVFRRVGSATEADIVIAPHEYRDLRGNRDYFERVREEACVAGKKLLVSAYQDDPAPIDLPGTLILRSSAYRSSLRSNEVVMPAYVEDMGAAYGFEPLPKGERATIGFAGKAGFSGARERLRYVLRNYLLRHGPDREGLYFRRAALQALAQDPRLDLRTIVRRHYSAHRKTVEVPPDEARSDYVRSIKESLFTLAPRGDGNYSLRFFETLSLGRIPILIDTDTPLPLEDVVPYERFIVRVPWQDIARLPEKVAEFFAEHSSEELMAMQREARAAFERYLYMPAFLRTVLTKERLESLV